MKIKMEMYLKGLKKEIKRTIQVNDNIKLQTFCEYAIVSMNGNCKHLYQLVLNEEEAYLGPGCAIKDFECEEMMDEKKLEYLDLDISDKLLLNYDFRSDWDFIIKIKKIEEGYFEQDFEVIDGCGCGIIEDCYGVHNLKKIVDPEITEQNKRLCQLMFPECKNYNINKFDINDINDKIRDYLDKYYELVKPKRYEMNVTLDGYDKEIKRKISVDSNVRLLDFARLVIYSMRGDLSHMYSIKKGKEYLEDDVMDEKDLNYLELKQNQKLKVIYDMGDYWTFNITVKKVIEDYGRKRFEVLSGKGYGIIDDCGGIGGLYEIFEGINKEWGDYDINDFDLEEINKIIDIAY